MKIHVKEIAHWLTHDTSQIAGPLTVSMNCFTSPQGSFLSIKLWVSWNKINLSFQGFPSHTPNPDRSIGRGMYSPVFVNNLVPISIHKRSSRMTMLNLFARRSSMWNRNQNSFFTSCIDIPLIHFSSSLSQKSIRTSSFPAPTQVHILLSDFLLDHHRTSVNTLSECQTFENKLAP